MTSHKVPAYVEFKDTLPKSGVKLLRWLLRDEEVYKLIQSLIQKIFQGVRSTVVGFEGEERIYRTAREA